MPEQRTKSELLFDQYLTEHGYDFDPQPRVPGKTSKLDHIVRFDGAEIFFEVKEFDEGEELPDGAFDPYKRIYLKLKGSWKQLNEYREYPCSLVLYTDGAAPVYLKPEFVLGAMLGTVTYITDKKSKEVGRFFGNQSGFLTGHMIDYKNKMPRSTQFSSIIVLETFPLGQIKLSPLLDERKKHRESNSSSIENAVDTFQYIERLKSEGFDIGETVLRVVVYENPFAAKPLTRRIFQGLYDERWGSNKLGMIESLAIALMRRAEGQLPDWIMKRLFRLFLRFSRSRKIVKIFEGPKLREIEAALRSYRRPPLVKAGIMKDR